MTTEISTFLSAFSADLSPIKEQAVRYFDRESKIREDGAAQIFRRPWVAPSNFGLLLFPPADNAWFTEFHRRTNKAIPERYQEILSHVNGCFVYDFSLYGLPKTLYTAGLLNRKNLQQYDLGAANSMWIRGYKVSKELFYFGGRAYSYDENVGYFLDDDKIMSIRKNGEVINTWMNVSDFLSEEVSICEQKMLEEKK